MSARRDRLGQLVSENRALVFYESSRRIVLDGDLAGLHAQVEAGDNQRKGEFVVMVQGADDEQSQSAEGRRLQAKLGKHLPPSIAAKLAVEISGAPRKAVYGAVIDFHRAMADSGN